MRAYPIEHYQAIRNSAPCLSRAATLPKGTKLGLGRGAHLGTPSSANHTAAASQPTGWIAKAASWLHLLRVSPALHPPERPSHTQTSKPGFGGRGHESPSTKFPGINSNKMFRMPFQLRYRISSQMLHTLTYLFRSLYFTTIVPIHITFRANISNEGE